MDEHLAVDTRKIWLGPPTRRPPKQACQWSYLPDQTLRFDMTPNADGWAPRWTDDDGKQYTEKELVSHRYRGTEFRSMHHDPDLTTVTHERDLLRIDLCLHMNQYIELRDACGLGCDKFSHDEAVLLAHERTTDRDGS
jgi:hypothetical protein